MDSWVHHYGELSGLMTVLEIWILMCDDVMVSACFSICVCVGLIGFFNSDLIDILRISPIVCGKMVKNLTVN